MLAFLYQFYLRKNIPFKFYGLFHLFENTYFTAWAFFLFHCFVLFFGKTKYLYIIPFLSFIPMLFSVMTLNRRYLPAFVCVVSSSLPTRSLKINSVVCVFCYFSILFFFHFSWSYQQATFLFLQLFYGILFEILNLFFDLICFLEGLCKLEFFEFRELLALLLTFM